MTSPFLLREAASVVRAGGVLAYPTESVMGFGCDPINPAAVSRLLELKRRPTERGLILLLADVQSAHDWLHPSVAPAWANKVSANDDIITWVVPAAEWVPTWLTGGRATLAVRVARHPIARALCQSVGHPLVSTSANLYQHPSLRSPTQVRRVFRDRVDGIVAGQCGPLRAQTEIRDWCSGEILRRGF